MFSFGARIGQIIHWEQQLELGCSFLNPIEYVWAYTNRQLEAIQLQFADLEKTGIREEICQNSLKTYSNRCLKVEACLKNTECPTLY